MLKKLEERICISCSMVECKFGVSPTNSYWRYKGVLLKGKQKFFEIISNMQSLKYSPEPAVYGEKGGGRGQNAGMSEETREVV